MLSVHHIYPDLPLAFVIMLTRTCHGDSVMQDSDPAQHLLGVLVELEPQLLWHSQLHAGCAS
jgi:hypothetical protein